MKKSILGKFALYIVRTGIEMLGQIFIRFCGGAAFE